MRPALIQVEAYKIVKNYGIINGFVIFNCIDGKNNWLYRV
jgi:hypothetical protein